MGLRFVTAAACLGLLLGCTLEKEDSLEQIDEAHVQQIRDWFESDDVREKDFRIQAGHCVTGQMDGFETLVKTFFSSMARDFEPRYLFQRADNNSLYEKCLQKAISLGQGAFSDEYALLNPFASAAVARSMYAQNRLADGAYWIRRVLGLQGLMQGYETAGAVFVRQDETYETGIRMLGEAAQLGSRTALQLLMEQLDRPRF